MTARVRGAASDGETASDPRYLVEFEVAGSTNRFPCAPGVFPHYSTLVPYISAFRANGNRTGEVRLVDMTAGTVVVRRGLERPIRPFPRQHGIRTRSQIRSPLMTDHDTDRQSQSLAVSERAHIQLTKLRRQAEFPPGVAIAIHPGEGTYPRFAAKRPDATDTIVATNEDGSPMLVVPAQAADAMAGALLDFVVTPEPGFVVLP